MANAARIDSQPLANINVTPLVDVLLVLLIIFMITAPVITHRTRIDLPAPNRAVVDDSARVDIRLRADGALYWNNTPVDEAQMRAQMAVAAHSESAPTLRFHTDDGASYNDFARLLAMAKQQGLERFDFVNSP